MQQELDQQESILEELQRLLALQAEEQKLVEMLAALNPADDGVPAPVEPHHLSCYLSVLIHLTHNPKLNTKS